MCERHENILETGVKYMCVRHENTYENDKN